MNHGMYITESDPTTADLFVSITYAVPKSKAGVHIHANANPHHC
jgi:hypothetical protein